MPYTATLFATTRFDDWLAFYRANPAVYAAFLRLAREAHGDGFTRWGARNIWERLRYEFKRSQLRNGGGEPKLNDHHVPYYARLVMARHPELSRLFVTKGERFDTDVETLVREADRIDQSRTTPLPRTSQVKP